MTEKIGTNSKAPKFEVNDRVRIIKYKNTFSKGYTENWSREIFIINSVLKINPWTYKINNEIVKNRKFHTLKTKVNNLAKEIPEETTLIHINQYNADKQNLQKKIEDVDNKLVKLRTKYQILVV